MLNKIVSVTLCLSFISYIGCTDTDNLSRGQFVHTGQSGNIEVLTKDQKSYHFNESHYRITNDSIIGRGTMVNGSGAETLYVGGVPLADVSFVQVEHPNGVKTALLVAGVTAGAVLIVALAASQSQPSYTPAPSGTNMKMSCPFVYTYDGTQYHFESETFSGAVFKGLERSNYDNLYHLKPVDGHYRLKLANAGEETEYVDELKLMLIDHPAGTSVIPDRKGIIHTISHPESPLRCTDFGGTDALNSILTKDHLYWRSDLKGKSFSDERDFRDGLIVEFPKPPHAQIAKIVVNGINSHLGFFALENIFKLKGDRKLSWYQQLENNPAERGKFIQWLMREGMLHLQVWENDAWVERAAMLDVGPGIAKDQIALLDVSKIPGNILKIGLEAATDLWRIDQVYADYTQDATVALSELSPSSALNEQGHDVGELLSNPDQHYYTTVPGQFANMTFKEIPRQHGLERSYVLKTRGFYYEWIDSKGPEQTAMLERILNEPLFGSKVLMTEWMKNKDRYGEPVN